MEGWVSGDGGWIAGHHPVSCQSWTPLGNRDGCCEPYRRGGGGEGRGWDPGPGLGVPGSTLFTSWPL